MKFLKNTEEPINIGSATLFVQKSVVSLVFVSSKLIYSSFFSLFCHTLKEMSFDLIIVSETFFLHCKLSH